MTTFTIPAEMFLRLAQVGPQPGEEESRDWLRCVRINHLNSKSIAIASNGRVLAGELIGNVEGDDDFVCITTAPALLELARNADHLVIVKAPGWTVITTDTGAMYPGNGEIDGSAWPNWTDLIPTDLPTKNNGCFSFSGRQMSRLCASAPSGVIRCAKNIDMTQPTIVRDCKDENWFGIFLVADSPHGPNEAKDRKQSYDPATIPEWLRS